MDGELGCVTPYIICPGGAWSQADLDYHAAQVGLVCRGTADITLAE